MVSYGLAYGMEAYGLGQRLNIPTDEAAEILSAYFVGLPEGEGVHGAHGHRGPQAGVHRDAVRAAPAHPGAAVVELAHPPGRRAPGDERRHPGPRRRHLQGGAGAPRRRARGGRLRARLVLQVHDEVLVEVAEGDEDEVGELTHRTCWRGAADLRVPLEVNLAFGPSWADAKG